jgi:hypothetical protein
MPDEEAVVSTETPVEEVVTPPKEEIPETPEIDEHVQAVLDKLGIAEPTPEQIAFAQEHVSINSARGRMANEVGQLRSRVTELEEKPAKTPEPPTPNESPVITQWKQGRLQAYINAGYEEEEAKVEVEREIEFQREIARQEAGAAVAPLAIEVVPTTISREVRAAIADDPRLANVDADELAKGFAQTFGGNWNSYAPDQRKNAIITAAKEMAFDALTKAKPTTPRQPVPGGPQGGPPKPGVASADEMAAKTMEQTMGIPIERARELVKEYNAGGR